MSGPVGVFVGLATLDVIHRIAAPPAVNQKITSTEQFVAAGGPAANAAVTFAALGGHAVLVTALGDEPVADLIRTDLRRFGVTVIDAAAGTARAVPVSAVSVVESTGDRSVVSADAVSSEVQPPADLDAVLADADIVLVDGHHPRMARAAADMAAARSLRVVVDAGRWKPIMAELVPQVTDMVCSADFRMPGTDDPDTSAAALVAAGVPTVVTTHGGGPIRWWNNDSSGSVDVPSIRPVDTLGAGDVFHGAYSFFSTQMPSELRECLDRSARVAALRCAVVGPRSWIRELPSLQTRKR